MHTITSKSGKNITLRPPTLADTQIMLDYINAIGMEDIYVNVNPADLYTFKEEKIFVHSLINKIEKHQEVYFLAFHNKQLIGSVSIEKGVRRSKHKGTFGITLSKGYRSDGIGNQIAEYAIDHAKNTLDLHMITLSAFAQNSPAINLYQKLGFKQYGHLPNGYIYKNDYKDEILMYKRLA